MYALLVRPPYPKPLRLSGVRDLIIVIRLNNPNKESMRRRRPLRCSSCASILSKLLLLDRFRVAAKLPP
jgi:hypothetical protein